MSENKPTRLERLEADEKKKKLIIKLIVAILTLIFLGGIGLGVYSLLLTPSTGELADSLRSPVSAAPASKDEAVLYFQQLLSKENDGNKTKIRYSTSADVPDDSISDDSPDSYLDDTLKYIKNDIVSRAADMYGSYDGAFGEAFTDKLVACGFTAGDLASFECTDDNEDGLRHLTLVFKDSPYPLAEDSVLYSCFDMRSAPDVAKKLSDDLSSFAKIEDSVIKCSGFTITAAVDKYTDELSYIDYIRNYDAQIRLLFEKWPVEQLGSRTVSFKYSAKLAYNFTRAGVSLSEHELWLEKGDSRRLEAKRTVDGDTKVTWSSSNPDVVEIDEDGYVFGKSVSDTPVTISASIEYLGNTYTDSCPVYVRKPVERIALSSKELDMSAGDTAPLGLVFDPQNSTVQIAFWFSEDESIASVGDDGTVEALSPGQTIVYAISLDGKYKAECTVTVK